MSACVLNEKNGKQNWPSDFQKWKPFLFITYLPTFNFAFSGEYFFLEERMLLLVNVTPLAHYGIISQY